MIQYITPMDPRFSELVMIINKYEKEIIIPRLSKENKANFKISTSVIKYVDLKIRGEVIGGLLNRLRSEMFQAMIKYSNIIDMVENAEKKTVCFTTFLDVADITYKHFTDNNWQPLIVTGATSTNVNSILKEFKTNKRKNPLIATIQTLSTGVTLIEANVVIFLSGVWRSVDHAQASDRVHRIGQDTPVFIYNFILKTTEPDNLSTRMDSILNWSAEQFDQIVGTTSSKLDTHALFESYIDPNFYDICKEKPDGRV
jgi:SNF2 family DNA or RNA helicase